MTKIAGGDPAEITSPFEEDELRDRILEAFDRASRAPRFSHMAGGEVGLGLSREQRDFVHLWIEEALRYARAPNARQAHREKWKQWGKDNLHTRLTAAQRTELLRVHQFNLDYPNATRRERKAIPLATFRALHREGLVSTKEDVTELGAFVVKKLTGTKNRA